MNNKNTDQYGFLKREKTLLALIDGSRYRCEKEGLPPKRETLPEVLVEDIERCKGHVSGHIHMMRNSSPEYYRYLTELLSANGVCLLYLYNNYDIFGRYGSQQLKDELKNINLRLGANLGEERVGTNAAVMASRYPDGAWVVGDEHYIQALKPYACYAFQIHGRYDRDGLIMLVTHKENLNEQIAALFKFIESTESIVTGGFVTEDLIIKDTLLKNEYSKRRTDNIMMIVDGGGIVTYANEVFYDIFKKEPMNTINEKLSTLFPELAFVDECLKNGEYIRKKRVDMQQYDIPDCVYLLDCMPIRSEKNKLLGALVTAYKQPLHKLEETGGNNAYAAHYSFDDLIGVADVFVHLKSFAKRISNTMSPVLIQGESGTGKELFAHAIHNYGDRSHMPFVAINCAAIPRDLIGSELFGYVGGSFTGANRSGAKGKFELANGGTLFLDEIGEMPLEMQSVLLRVLEENAVTRIGGQKPIPVDVRLITATNRNLLSYIDEGKFRSDLYYRINVVNLNLIPLRKRREDIPALVEAFVRNYSAENGIHINGVSSEAMHTLIEYSWPGNIRELRNVIEQSVIICDSGCIEQRHLPPNIRGTENLSPTPLIEADKQSLSLSSRFAAQRLELAKSLMKKYSGNKTKVANEMGISRSTLYRILGVGE